MTINYDSLNHILLNQIVDTLAAHHSAVKCDDINALDRMRDYYDSAFNHLMAVEGVIVAVALFVLGYIVPKSQRKKLQIFKKSISNAQFELQKISNETKVIENALDKKLFYVEALAFNTQGLHLESKGKWGDAFASYRMSPEASLKSDTFDNSKVIVENLQMALNNIKEKSSVDFFSGFNRTLDEQLKRTLELSKKYPEIYHDFADLKRKLDSM